VFLLFIAIVIGLYRPPFPNSTPFYPKYGSTLADKPIKPKSVLCLYPFSLIQQLYPVEPRGQEPVAPPVRRNPPKLQSSFAMASEDTRIPPPHGKGGFLRRRGKFLPGEIPKDYFIGARDKKVRSHAKPAKPQRKGRFRKRFFL